MDWTRGDGAAYVVSGHRCLGVSSHPVGDFHKCSHTLKCSHTNLILRLATTKNYSLSLARASTSTDLPRVQTACGR